METGRMECEAHRQQIEQIWTRIHIWVDSKEAIKRLQYTNLGLGQWLARCIIKRAEQLRQRGTAVEIHLILGHIDIEENRKLDKAAKEAAEKAGIQGYPERLASLPHVERTITE